MGLWDAVKSVSPAAAVSSAVVDRVRGDDGGGGDESTGFEDMNPGGSGEDGFSSSTDLSAITSEKDVVGFVQDNYEAIDEDDDGYISDDELETVQRQFEDAGNVDGAFVIKTLADGSFNRSEQTEAVWNRDDGDQSYWDDIRGSNDDKISGNDLERVSSHLEDGQSLDEISGDIEDSSVGSEEWAEAAGETGGGGGKSGGGRRR